MKRNKVWCYMLQSNDTIYEVAAPPAASHACVLGSRVFLHLLPQHSSFTAGWVASRYRHALYVHVVE